MKPTRLVPIFHKFSKSHDPAIISCDLVHDPALPSDCETCDYSISMSADEPPTYTQAQRYPVSFLLPLCLLPSLLSLYSLTPSLLPSLSLPPSFHLPFPFSLSFLPFLIPSLPPYFPLSPSPHKIGSSHLSLPLRRQHVKLCQSSSPFVRHCEE